MQKMKWILMLVLLCLSSGNVLAQVSQQHVEAKETLDAGRGKARSAGLGQAH